jgi:hypothetical protein
MFYGNNDSFVVFHTISDLPLRTGRTLSFDSAPQPIMDVLFFTMKGTRNRGNRSNYRKLLSEETLLDETSLQNAMLDRDYWRTITR